MDFFNTAIKRFQNDKNELKNWLSLSDILIKEIIPLNGSDKHRNSYAFLLTFNNDMRLIYKPVDLQPDILFSQFVENLDLKFPFNVRTLEVLPKLSYGWIKFINQHSCQTHEEIQNFYRRMGVLLTIADALNYSDGHCENLIADGDFPVLIDCETLFQNYEPSVMSQKNILSTMLIQKAKVDNDETFPYSALQAPNGIKYEYLQTHAINDRTDKLEIRYRCVNPSQFHHCPIIKNTYANSYDYVSEILEGYNYGYDRITKKTSDILSNSKWWNTLTQTQSRTVIRETSAYLYLIRKILHPEGLANRESALKILMEKLKDTAYTPYEIDDILNLNIPYFYHLPGKRHIFDGKGKKYPNVFTFTAIEVLKQQFLKRSEEKKRFDCDIISRHLIPFGFEPYSKFC